MPQYGSRCKHTLHSKLMMCSIIVEVIKLLNIKNITGADNVKSGKVLLELADVELETELGILHPLHRKKLRLAIEEHRNPALVRFPCIAG